MTLSKGSIDRVIIARLSVPKDSKKKDEIEPSHFEYLMGVFERASDEERRLARVIWRSTKEKKARIHWILNICSSLFLSWISSKIPRDWRP